jgi:hypothetical protein
LLLDKETIFIGINQKHKTNLLDGVTVVALKKVGFYQQNIQNS